MTIQNVENAALVLWLQMRALVNRANGCPEAARQLESLARSLKVQP